MRSWHLVYTKPGKEQLALSQLERQGYEAWLPLAREGRVISGKYRVCNVPLFPRYLFVNLDAAIDNVAPIRSTVGCCGLVRFGLILATLPIQAIDAIRLRCDDSGCVRLCADWEPGTRLKVIEGPLVGFDAIFKSHSPSGRVVIFLEWLSSNRTVHLAPESLRLTGE